MKHGNNDKDKMKNSDLASGSDKNRYQQPSGKIGIMTRFLNWIAKGAKNLCPT
jgi:hypothetical protein